MIADLGEQTGWLGGAIFTTPAHAHAHTHLEELQQSTPVVSQHHLVENGAITLSPAQLGQLRSQEKSHCRLSLWTIKCYID